MNEKINKRKINHSKVSERLKLLDVYIDKKTLDIVLCENRNEVDPYKFNTDNVYGDKNLFYYYSSYWTQKEKYREEYLDWKGFHPFLMENLKSFYIKNKEFLTLKIDISKWDSQTLTTTLFETNKKVRGQIKFDHLYYYVSQVKGSSFISIKRYLDNEVTIKDLDISYYCEFPTSINRFGVTFPNCENGKYIYSEISKMVQNIIDQNVKYQVDYFKNILDEKKQEKKEIENLKETLFSKLDLDNNGTIDIVEEKNDFNQLLSKYQKIIIKKGRDYNQNYTHQFVKVGNYVKGKRDNLQLIFDCIKKVQNKQNLNEYITILENEIHSYNLLLINSLNLIVSLIEDEQLIFYDIYERFDKLNIFNSNWENEVSQKLTTLNKSISELNSNIQDLMYEIRNMGNKIVRSIEDLSFITDRSSRMLDDKLKEINSSLDTNNLLTLINTYQTYKVNKNTKSLRD